MNEVANIKGQETPLPVLVKIAYGAPSFAGAAMAIPIAIHLTIFYSDTILVPLGFIALIKALARALDAVTDPLMGWASDRTNSRWGRRRPWIAVGAPLASIFFYLMFTPPDDLNGVDAAAWFAATYTLYYLFHTVYIIPHNALGPELTLSYHERSTLFGIREGFVVAGTLVAAVLPPLLISLLGGDREGYEGFAVIFGSLLTLLYFHLVWRIQERPDFVVRKSNPLIPGVRRVMRNKVFRILLVVYLVGSITGAIPGLMMPYFTKYVLQPDDYNRWLAIFLAVYFGSGFACLPIWVWAARKFEKKPVWLVGFLPGITGSVSLFFMGEGDLIATALVLAIAGAGFSASLFLSPAMQADVIDYDELHTGKRREAQYGALWSIMTKFMVIPSMSIPLAILAGMGFVPNVVQSDTVQFTIRLIFCFGPAVTAIIALSIAVFYPISKLMHDKILAGIEAHKRGQIVEDPITGHKLLPPGSRGLEEDVGWELDHFSVGELRLLIDSGARAVRLRILCLSVVSVLATFIFVGLLLSTIDVDHAPGLVSVLYVVGMGIALTSSIYHFIRYRVAKHLHLYESQTVEMHIAITREMQLGIANPHLEN